MSTADPAGPYDVQVATLEALDQPVLLCSPEGTVRYGNAAATQLAALLWPDFAWRDCPLAQPFAAPERATLEDCQLAAAGGRGCQCEVSAVDRHGVRRMLVVKWRPVPAPAGGVASLCVVWQDITPTHTAEQTLGLLRRALDAIAEGVLLADAEQRPIFYNRAFERLARHDGGGDVSLRRLLASPEAQAAAAAGRAWSGEIEGAADEGVYWHEVSVTPLLNEAGETTHLVGIREDITARKLMERSLEENRSRMQAVITTAMDGIISFDESQRIVLINQAACAMFEISEEHGLGRSILDLLPGAPIARAATPDADQNSDSAGGLALGERQGRRANGEMFPVEFSLSEVTLRGRQLYTIILRDVTERRRLHEQVLRQQRLESVGRLASGLAHDLNNILTPILMVPGMLRGRTTDSMSLSLLDLLEQGARRGASIIDQLLTFARELPGERKMQHLGSVVDAAARIIRETFPKNIELEVQADPQAWPFFGDATQVQQLLLNLAINAKDAMPTGGRLVVQVSNERMSAETARVTPGAKPGAYVVLSVIDTGLGIAPDILERIFDPFFSTKGLGEGTGLGLSAALGIARSHDGFITVRSQPHAGATFRIYFPAIGVEESGEGERPPREPNAPGSTVLVVDDEDHLRLITRQLLVQNGYTAICARDGEAALAHFRSADHGIDLVLTDLAMPGMGGDRLIAHLRRQVPQLPIVVMTGHDPTRRVETGQLPVDGVIRKPFSGAELLRVLEEAGRSRRRAAGAESGA